MTQNQSPPRPTINPTSIRVAQAKKNQVDIALNVVDIFSEIRQMAMCPECEGAGEMKPKEEATYNAALDRLERYLDEEMRGE